EELHALRDHLGDVALVAVLVVVLARPDGAFEEHLAALRQILAAGLRLLPPHYDVVPLGAFLALALLVGPYPADRDRAARHRAAGRGEAHFGILPEVADDQHFVERHGRDDSRVRPAESTQRVTMFLAQRLHR